MIRAPTAAPEAMSIEHWNRIYVERGESGVSWFDPDATSSLAVIDRLGLPPSAAVIDVGGGASRFVDGLMARGFSDLTVLDLSIAGLAIARARLGPAAERVRWLVADATRWSPDAAYEFWHDRAVFHFLTESGQRRAYVERLRQALAPGGYVMFETFAPDGPDRCSGLQVQRHDAASLAASLGEGFELLDQARREHVTPKGTIQRFQTSLFRADWAAVATSVPAA
jgi:trans-aconitate methyltransferase